MAVVTSNKRKKRDNEYSDERYSSGIRQEDIVAYTKDNVVRYGVNIVLARSLASLIDGLTPVRRKILYMMYHDENLVPSKPRKKVSEWLSRASKYYAHGTQSIDKTFDSIIKDWETNCQLLDIHGNTGSVVGTRPAAVRYLEGRLSLYAYKCFFEEFDEDAIDMVPNYLQSALEPVWLPAKYPNFLVSASSGIAWGYGMSLAPFNVVEAFELTKRIIQNPDMRPEEAFLFPDSPRGYEIYDDGKCVEKCMSGHGTFAVRAILKPRTLDTGETVIEVTGFPEMVTMDDTIREIGKLIASKELYGIQDISDQSDLGTAKYYIHLRKGTDILQVIAQLYQNPKTKLTGICTIDFNFANDLTVMENISMYDAIRYWCERRVDYLQKYYIRKLSAYEKKYHSYCGLLSVMDDKRFNLASRIIRNSEDDAEMITQLANQLNLTTYQAEVVSNITLRDNNKTRRAKLQADAEKIPMLIKQVEELVQSRQNLDKKICDDLDEGIELFGRPRQCKIVGKNSFTKKIDLQYRILVTKTSIKKMPAGNSQVGMVDDEVVGYYLDVTNNHKLMIINDTGTVFVIDIKKLKTMDAGHRGFQLLDVIGMTGTAIFSYCWNSSGKISKAIATMNLYMFTLKGIVKATKLTEYLGTKSSTIKGIVLNDGDVLSAAYAVNPKEDPMMLVYTPNGNGIMQDLRDITVTSRLSKGQRWMAFAEDDLVQGICTGITDTSMNICIITQKGYVKICTLDDIFVGKKRRVNMLSLTRLVAGDSVIKIFKMTDEDQQFGKIVAHMASGKRVDVNCDSIRVTTRLAKGEKRIPVPRGDSIVKLRLISK